MQSKTNTRSIFTHSLSLLSLYMFIVCIKTDEKTNKRTLISMGLHGLLHGLLLTREKITFSSSRRRRHYIYVSFCFG